MTKYLIKTIFNCEAAVQKVNLFENFAFLLYQSISFSRAFNIASGDLNWSMSALCWPYSCRGYCCCKCWTLCDSVAFGRPGGSTATALGYEFLKKPGYVVYYWSKLFALKLKGGDLYSDLVSQLSTLQNSILRLAPSPLSTTRARWSLTETNEID